MYLGIDLGTSALKALLLADDGHIVAQQSAPLEVSRPHPQWSEQSPADWWSALGIALGELARAHPAAMRAVRAIGLSGQMHGAVLLDAAGEVLRPAILWNDGRSEPQCAELAARVPRLGQIAGNLAMPGFTAPKLLWVKDHQPQIFGRIAKVLLPKDWLRLKLSGEFFTDCSDASGTLWLDVGARDWSDELLAACDLTRAQMPALVEGSAPAGRLKADVAERFGLPVGIVIAGGGGDNAASAVGMGATAPGDGFVSLGTSGVIFLCSDRFLPAPESAVHAFCHALPGAWHQMSVMLSAASALRWVTQLTDRRDEAELLAEVEALDERALDQAPLFLPYLAGERTPHNDAHAQGVLFGLTHEHGAAALGYAVIEGVAFGLLDGWHTLDESTRALANSLDIVGGGARSATWARLLATLLDRPLTKRDGGEAGGALGAARLAWLADGGDLATVCAKQPVVESFQPQPARRAALMARYARFRKLYPLLKESFRDQ
ncbi:MAG: xylulokinase [Caulobacter sp.]|nr:xylulokinase [Vitreoscilla sp.]